MYAQYNKYLRDDCASGIVRRICTGAAGLLVAISIGLARTAKGFSMYIRSNSLDGEMSRQFFLDYVTSKT